MTDWINDLPLDDDLQLDLLVDNELNEAQRQRLLTWLEGEPERWRSVALRFVESQMLTTGVGRWTAETRDTETPVRPVGTWRGRVRNRWFMVLAVCAAFGCGLAVEAWRSGEGPDGRQVAEVETPEIPEPAESFLMPLPEGSSGPVNERPRPVARRGMSGRSLKVPLRLVQASAGPPTWTPRVQLTPSRERKLQQAGLDVQRRPGTVRIPLGGERYVMMPAQHLQVVPRVRYRI